MPKGRNTKRTGRKKQNQIVLQQLANGQYILTIPGMWVDILGMKKGDVVTFQPHDSGVAVVPVNDAKRQVQKRRKRR